MFGEIIYHHALLRPSCRAILKLTSPVAILIILNLLTRSALALVTKYPFVFLVTNLNNKNNVFKQCCLLYFEDSFIIQSF